MAERSKAPDSRLKPSQHAWESERSGLRMEAWVRIPLLTGLFKNVFPILILETFLALIQKSSQDHQDKADAF